MGYWKTERVEIEGFGWIKIVPIDWLPTGTTLEIYRALAPFASSSDDPEIVAKMMDAFMPFIPDVIVGWEIHLDGETIAPSNQRSPSLEERKAFVNDLPMAITARIFEAATATMEVKGEGKGEDSGTLIPLQSASS